MKSPASCPAPGDVTDPLRVGAAQIDLANPYERADRRYQLIRPPYPAGVIDTIMDEAAAAGGSKIADIGAGTGILTVPLHEAGAQVIAVEPASAMAEQLRQIAPEIDCRCTTAEATGLAAAAVNIVTYAQSWHWVDPVAASTEAERILTETGRICVLFNQLDVRIGWVKRLTRIMRSGDIHRRERPPQLGSGFGELTYREFCWSQRVTPAQVALIGQTRSSYLRASAQGRLHLQNNLSWYLHDFLAISPDSHIDLPYVTMLWTAQRR